MRMREALRMCSHKVRRANGRGHYGPFRAGVGHWYRVAVASIVAHSITYQPFVRGIHTRARGNTYLHLPAPTYDLMPRMVCI